MGAETGDTWASPQHADKPYQRRWAQLRKEWHTRLEPGEQATVLAWAAFTFTFAGLRGLTHWIRAGHGGSSVGRLRNAQNAKVSVANTAAINRPGKLFMYSVAQAYPAC